MMNTQSRNNMGDGREFAVHGLTSQEITLLTDSLLDHMRADEEFQRIVARQYARTFSREDYAAWMMGNHLS